MDCPFSFDAVLCVDPGGNNFVDVLSYGIGAPRVFYRVFKNFGGSWGMQYAKGLLAGYFSGGSKCANLLEKAVSHAEIEYLRPAFVNSKSKVHLPKGVTIHSGRLLQTFKEMKVKDFRLNKDSVFESGYKTAIRFTINVADRLYDGVGILTIDPDESKIQEASLFW